MDKPLFEELELENKPFTEAPPAGELVLGIINSVEAGKAWVTFDYQGMTHKAQAMATSVLGQEHVGRQAAISFVGAQLGNPIILGCIQSPLYEMLENFEVSKVSSEKTVQESATPKTQDDNTLTVDGKTVVVKAEEQLRLQCGESSITLTQEGKILIRGKYLLNRASGVNRIVGGSVQVN